MNENENNDFGFDEFESALFGDDGYQTDTTDGEQEESAETEDQQEDTEEGGEAEQEGEEEPDGEENTEDEHTSDSEESPAEDGAEPDKEDSDTFTLKVNKQEQQVSRDQVISLAQKGLDYDRVKEQSQRHQQTIQELQETISKNQGVIDILELISSQSKMPLSDVAESLYYSFRKGAGVSEAEAKLELKNARLDKELNSMKSQKAQDQQESQQSDAEARYQKDMEEFKAAYPGVQLTEDVVDKLVPDVRAGMSLTAAYRKMERAQESARIAELERQIAAMKKNKSNKQSTPGSQQDSGGRRVKDDYEAFEEALFG